MTLAFSTSSPWASVAAFDDGGKCFFASQAPAQQRASAVCLEFLDHLRKEMGVAPDAFQIFAADVGPGSFTGVRVGVVLAKTLAYVAGGKVVGADAFDLIASDALVALPSRKGEYFLRTPGQAPIRTTQLDEAAIGYGPDFADPKAPSAAAFGVLLPGLTPVDPFAFMPEYLIEPSISVPKKAFGSEVRGG